MKAIGILLKIRCKQLYRLFSSVGWPLLIIGLPIIIVFILGLYERSTNSYSLSAIFLLTLSAVHFSRNDRWHLVHLGYAPLQILVIEYLIGAVVIGGIHLILVHTAQNFGLMIIGSLVIAILPKVDFSKLSSQLFFPVGCIPISYFEWRVGIRKTGWTLVVINIICSFFSYVSPIFPIVGIILLSLLVTSWYKDFEPISMISHDDSSTRFIVKKIFQLIIWILIITVPMTFTFIWHYLNLWYLLSVVLVFSILINSFAICYKYAAYHPSRKSAQSELAVAIFSYSALVPFFMPVCIVYVFIYARRAYRNINDLYASS